ncbi:MAG: hypothetical protein Q3971_05015 [Moraxella sp.]|nr:hypothetical protein [Moraxella sp.]
MIEAMEGVISEDRSLAANIMLHKNRTVSVGLSGNVRNEKTQQNMQNLQSVLDRKYGSGRYKVGFNTLGENQGLVQVKDSNMVGLCAEPKCT